MGVFVWLIVLIFGLVIKSKTVQKIYIEKIKRMLFFSLFIFQAHSDISDDN